MIRAYAKYVRQTGFTFSQAYIEQTLAAHPGIASKLVALFHARFDPSLAARRDELQKKLNDEVWDALNAVPNADEDKILRRFLYLLRATLRTNHWVRGADGKRKPYLSFKFASTQIPELPDPRPLFEVWVYSPRFEAIHLRSTKVARGGLRWSDRPEDFRTEILGLMKAQVVKNAVIVPSGSKGGFVLKNAPPASDRDAFMKEGIACYQNFLRGLLDVTDNLVSGKVVPPRDVVRHDADDPYLVVAADKGTATFSDIANGISAEYGFWLGDAFASGGSAGYDHKKMGITARGAWESVKRHFREMGRNIQEEDFTVVGIGDMSGDVFGNGMLLSRHIKLVAAFDHRHVFLDPNPDIAASFAERERLFNLARSSWDDYDKKLISAGGGVYPRTAKAIPVTPEMRAVLDIDATELTPPELLKAIVKAPADLFYNGGIGTYVKASRQSNTEAGDRANDAIRVNGRDLRCKVVGEGGNLGFTQLGRVEYALKGGRIFTDAIDNSAGVDCSDHEVNIKIMLGIVMEDGEMTDDVGRLVLADNYYQTQSLAVAGTRPDKLLDSQAAFIRALEKAGKLNRQVEYLPSDDEIAERRAAKAGLTAPERAVLLAYSKIVLSDELIAGTLVDDDYVRGALVGYFPALLQKRYAGVMPRHALKRDIIATVVANTMINRTGSVFVHRMQEETGATSEEATRAFILARDIFELDALWAEIDALDNQVPAQLQYEMLLEVGRLVVRATLWFLRRRREKLPIAEVLKIFRPSLAVLRTRLPDLLSPPDRLAWEATIQRLAEKGVPQERAVKLANLEALYGVLDVTEVSQEQKKSIEAIAAVYFALSGEVELRWISEKLRPRDRAPEEHGRGAEARALDGPRGPLGAAARAEVLGLAAAKAVVTESTEVVETRRKLDSLNLARLHPYRELFTRSSGVSVSLLPPCSP